MLVIKISLFNFDAYAVSGRFAELFNFKAIILAAVLLVLTRFVKFKKAPHPIVYIIASAAVGVIFAF